MADVTSVKLAESDETKAFKAKVKKADPQEEMRLLKEKMEAESALQRMEKGKRCFTIAAESRKRYDWEWLARDLFRRGYQFSRYNADTKTLIMSSTKSTRIPVNLTAAAMRSIRNQVTTFRPKWEISPDTVVDDASEDLPYIQKYLDNVWRVHRLKKKIKELLTQGLLYSVGGPFQIVWDKDIENSDGSKGNIVIYLIDPFDFFVDPKCTDGLNFSDAEFVIKAVRTPLEDVKTNPLYNKDVMKGTTGGESALAASPYKQFLLQSLKFINQTEIDENQSVILKEGYFKERGEDGKVRIRVMHWVDLFNGPLYEEVLDETEFPFIGYQADMNPLEVYGEGWARHAIAVNKIINALESSTFDYNYRYAKGRLVVDKNSGVKVVTNEHGSIIEKNRGSEVSPLPLQPLPQAVENQLARFRMYFEDITGVHEASMGRVPAGVKSGIGVAELKQSDATNQDDLVDNLEDFLAEVCRMVLKISAKNFKSARIVKPVGEYNKESFAVVGEGYMKGKKTYTIGKKEYKLAKIYENNDIHVSVGSWLAYSKEQRQAELKELFKLGVIDQKTLLEHLEFGDVQGILERTRKEKLMQARRQNPGTNPGDEDIAISENEMLMEGRSDVVAKQEDDHEIHIAVHQEILGQGNDELVNAHIQQHQSLMGQGGSEEEVPAPTGEATGEAAPAEDIPPELLSILTGGGA